MEITKAMMNRYSTKSFDTEKKISASDWTQLEDALRLAASSTNVQPWHFIVASTDEGKKRLADGAMDFNAKKIKEASHVVLICSKTNIKEDYLERILEKEDKDGRFKDESSKSQMHKTRSGYIKSHKDKQEDLQHWMEKQVYLSIGGVLVAAAVMGIDAGPMEGIDSEKLDEEFDLKEKDLTSLVIIAFGYRSDDDFNSKLPKSRLTKEEVFTKI